MGHAVRLSRRRFLQAVVVLAGLSIAGALAMSRWGAGLGPFLRSRLRGLLAAPALGNAPPGPLPEGVLGALLVTTQTLVDAQVETAHYAAFFRWRAETLRGYRALYERFAAVLDRAARDAHERDFVSCGPARRREILRQIDPTPAAGRLSRLYALAFRRESLRFEQYVFRQILALFSETDGWVWLGYESWPGTPRGLQSYTKAPGRP
jgi:hypothetical protein